MISDEYFHLDPIEKYLPFTFSCFFIGVRIKNRYDELRIKINHDFNPLRRIIEQTGDKFYGVIVKQTPEYFSVIPEIKHRKPFDYIGYNTLLNEYNLTCDEEFFKMNNFFFPIDYEHVKRISPNFNYSDYLCLNDGSADFQRFAQPELFIISID
jgi:hypothetical protein